MQQRAFASAGGTARRQKITAIQLDIDAAQHFEGAFAQEISLVNGFRREQGVIHSFWLPINGWMYREIKRRRTAALQNASAWRSSWSAAPPPPSSGAKGLFIAQGLHRFEPASAPGWDEAAQSANQPGAAADQQNVS